MSSFTRQDRQILFVARSWHGIGGMQRLNRDLCREIAKHLGSSFTCVYPTHPGIISLCVFVVESFFRGIHAKHVHLSDASLLPVGFLIRLFSRAPITMTACGLDVTYRAKWYQWMIRKMLHIPKKIICISHATALEVQKRGAGQQQMCVIPCGIYTTTIPPHPAAKPPFLLSVGRLIPRKGIAWFLQNVFPFLLKEYPELRYVIVGDGPERSHVASIIRSMKLEKNVELLRQCGNEERDRYLSTAAIFIMPNILVAGDIEGFGIVCLEAAQYGTQVAASKIEGLTDSVIEGKTGVFFPALDSLACKKAVIHMLETPLDRALVATTVREQYDWSRLISQYLDVLS